MKASPFDLNLSVSLPDPMDELPPFLEGAAMAEKPDLSGSTKRIKNVEPEILISTFQMIDRKEKEDDKTR